jgi:hypothetical protein
MSTKISRVTSSNLTKIKNQTHPNSFKPSGGSRYIKTHLSIDEMIKHIEK